MDFTFSRIKSLLLFIIVFQGFSSFGQSVLADNSGKVLAGQQVLCQGTSFPTNEKGQFNLVCKNNEIWIILDEIDTLKEELYFIKNDTIFLKIAYSTEIGTVNVITKRMHYFDISYLPPIRGVQIATGTNTIIEIERQAGAKSTGNPRELFSKVPGMNIWESDGAGIQMGVGGRGLSPDRASNFNTRQNGYDISADALGYPESYYTPPIEALSAIEIIRGSASLQYGTQFGGLLNFVLKEPYAKGVFALQSRVTVGNFGYLGLFNSISGTKNRFSYQVYHQYKSGNGYRENSDFFQHQFFSQLSYAINEKHKIRLESTNMTYTAQQAGGLTDFQFKEDPTKSYRNRNYFKVNWNILALHYDWEISKNTVFNIRAFGMLSQRQSLGFLGKINQVDPEGLRDLIKGDFKNYGSEIRLLHKYKTSKLVSGGVLVGARFYSGQTQNAQGYASSGNDADFRYLNPNDLENSDFSFPSKNFSFFVENLFYIGKKLTVNIGGRFEYIASASKGFYKNYAVHPINLDTIAVNTIYSESQSTRKVPLFGIGSSYKISKNSTIYSNFCMNYRAINFNDIRISNPNIIVDTAMNDEKGYTAELGWRGFLNTYFYVDIAGFYILYGDKIGLAPSGVKKIRTNIGDAVNKGVEFFTEFDFWKLIVSDSSKIGASIFLNCAYVDAKYVRSREPNYVGNQVEYVAPFIGRFGLKFRGDKWQTQVQFSFTDKQFADASNAIDPSGDAVIGQIPSYSILDCSFRYTFKHGIQTELGVNNLLNESYYTRRATAYPGPGILPADGRFFYLSLQYRFESKK